MYSGFVYMYINTKKVKEHNIPQCILPVAVNVHNQMNFTVRPSIGQSWSVYQYIKLMI